MNQVSRQTRQRRRAPKKNVFKRVVLSWAVVGALALGIGIGAGMTIAGGHSETPVAYGAPTGWTQREFAMMKTVPLDADFQRYVYETAKEYGLDWTLLMAVMQQESQFDIHAKSEGGDFGLMQINRINHANLSVVLGVHDFMDPQSNVRAGAYMLRELFDKYGDTHRVLMCYHMGETAAAEAWKAGVTETGYTRSVLRIQRELISSNMGIAV